jgi:hypothetical protein
MTFGFPFGGFHHGFGHGLGHHGFGHHGFGHHGFGHHLIPFFLLSLFSHGFHRNHQEEMVYAKHVAKQGDTMWKLAQKYNVPLPLLITFNTHIQNPNVFNIGDIIYIPRMCDMYCQKMYMEPTMYPDMASPYEMRYPTVDYPYEGSSSES